MTAIHALTMPKWGLEMAKGKVGKWLVEQGAAVNPGAELVEVETDKIVSAIEAPAAGILCRQVAREGDMTPVGGLLGVLAEAPLPEPEIDGFIANFAARFGLEDAAGGAGGAGPESVVVDGFTVRYLKRGQGTEAAVLIHGFGGDLNAWLFNHEHLAAARTVYALDLPGHGGSSKFAGSGALDVFTNLVLAFMDATGLETSHLAGHSMGGAVALDLALAHPGRVRSLTLIASAALGAEIDGQYIDGFISASRRKDLQPQVEKLFADPRLITRQLIEDILKYKRKDGVEAGLRAIAAQLYPGGRQAISLRDGLERLSMPVLAIWGSEDRIVPVSHCQGLPPNVRTVVLPGGGHMVQMEAAPKINQIIQEFWNDAGGKNT